MLDALVYLPEILFVTDCGQITVATLPYGHGTMCTKDEMLTGFCGVNDRNE